MRFAPGTRFGPYQITATLGAGGMGEVYRAHDSRLGRDVAIKILPADVTTDARRRKRFDLEARAVAGLSHPNIVVLHSVEEADGVRFLTMECVEGHDLREEVRAGGLPLSRVLEIAIPLAEALAAAHQRSIVHRDLKPANVMVTNEGRVKVLDFGLAKMVAPRTEEAQTLTAGLSGAGEIVGTVPYMAPEQLRGRTVDARTDLFAFGVLLYELLTGGRPFTGESSADIGSAILHREPSPLLSIRRDLPADIGRIVARCLEKDPERRMQTATDVRNELDLVRRAAETASSGTTGAGRLANAPDTSSIAVLPFVNRGRDQDDEFFADGVTEDVIAQLCKVRTLRVISRSSVMPFKNHEASVRDIAAKLQVATVLEGTVRRAGNRARIAAQLTEAVSGRTLWAETYDRDLTDIFSVQSDVACQIADALKAELSPAERRRLHHGPTADVQAYEHYLRGRQRLVRFSEEEMRASLTHFERAIERDPSFALAHVGLSMAYLELLENGSMSRDQIGIRAMSAAARAIALDPELSEGYCAYGHALMTCDADWAGAEAAFTRAIELSPNNADAHSLYGRLCYRLDRLDRAIALQERAFELDPLTHRSDIATSLLRAGRLEEAARAARRSIDLEPTDPRPRATLGWALFRQGEIEPGLRELERAADLSHGEAMWLAQLGEAYGLAGRLDQARDVLRRLEDPARPSAASPYHLAYVYTGLGEKERALDLLETAATVGVGPLSGIKGSFLLEPLRDHPRFAALLTRMKLV